MTFVRLLLGSVLLAIPAMAVPCVAKDPSMRSRLNLVMEKAARQQPITIAFFGGSITWGATASDPLRTSWRALVMQHFGRTFPNTPIKFVDAAIGGQPSRLGVFRMDRDVLPYRPDLVFIEFSINDGDSPENDESYEGIIRKLRRALPQTAIVPVVVGAANGEGKYVNVGREADLKILAHYGLPVIDLVPRAAQRVAEGLDHKVILTDSVHPTDAGYALYAQLIIDDLTRLATDHTDPADLQLPPPITANRFEGACMIELSKLGQSPRWTAGSPSVVGTWFDHQPSRWFDSIVSPTDAGATLAIPLPAGRAVTGIGLYFERQPNGQPLVVSVNGRTHATIETANDLQFARVHYDFQWLPSSLDHPAAILQAPKGGPAAAAYLLYTTAAPK